MAVKFAVGFIIGTLLTVFITTFNTSLPLWCANPAGAGNWIVQPLCH